MNVHNRKLLGEAARFAPRPSLPPDRRRLDARARAVARHIVLPAQQIAEAEIKPRESIAGLLRRLGWAKGKSLGFRLPTICTVNGEPVLRKFWRRRLKASDQVVFLSRPFGGRGGTKQVLGLVALIAVAAFAMWAGPAIAGAGLLGLTGTTATIVGGVVTAAIGIGGSLLINALVAPKAGAANTAPTDQITQLTTIAATGNQAKPLSPIPVMYGRLKTYPDFAATPWSEYVGTDQYLNVLLSLGLGKYDPHNVYVDDTIMWTSGIGVDPAFVAEVEFYDPDTPVTLFPTNVVSSVDVSGQEITTTPLGGFIGNASGTLANAIAIDLVFPAGCYTIDTSSGAIGSNVVAVLAEYRPVDGAGAPTGSYTTLFGQTFTLAQRSPYRISVKTAVTAGRYQVRVSRSDAPATGSAAVNNVAWAGYRSFIQGPSSFPVSTCAIRIMSSGQLTQASAHRFGVYRTRKIPVWNGSAMVDTATRNPLWAFYDAVINTGYGPGRPPSKIDFNAVVAQATAADDRGDTFDYEFAAAVAVPDALDTILKPARSRHFWSGDVISVVRDEQKDVPDMLLTDREIVRGSLSVDWQLNDEIAADAVIFQYIDENTWLPAEVQYPPDGDGFTAQHPATVRVDGIVNRDLAFREAAFYYLQSFYRRTNITLDTEFEGRRLSYGSIVQVQSELPQSWGSAGQIVSASGAALVLSPAPAWSGGSYYLRIRRPDGRAFGPVICTRGSDDAHAVLDAADLATVQTQQGITLSSVLARADGGEPASFDFGSATTQSKKCIVLSGRPNGQNLMTLMLAADDDRVHASDLGDPPALPALQYPKDALAPVIGLLTANFRQGMAEPILDATWWPSSGAAYYHADVSYDAGTSWTSVYEGASVGFSVVVDLASLRLRVQGVGARKGAYSTVDVDAPTIVIAPGAVADSSLNDYLKTKIKAVGPLQAHVVNLNTNVELAALAAAQAALTDAARHADVQSSMATVLHTTRTWVDALGTESLAEEIGLIQAQIDSSTASLTLLNTAVTNAVAAAGGAISAIAAISNDTSSIIQSLRAAGSGDLRSLSELSALAAAISSLTGEATRASVATDIQQMRTGFGQNFSSIVTTQTVFATDQVAQAQRITILEATVPSNFGTLSASVATEATARASGDSALASSISTLSATVSSNNTAVNAAISSEASTRATADSALSTSISSLSVTVSSNNTTLNASITTEAMARASGDNTNASSISTLSTTVGGHTSSLTQLVSSVGGSSVNAGFIGSIDGVTGGFLFEGIKVDGVTTYDLLIDGSLVVSGSITSAEIATSAITSSKIAANAITATHLSAAAFTAINAQITNLTATNIDSHYAIFNSVVKLPSPASTGNITAGTTKTTFPMSTAYTSVSGLVLIFIGVVTGTYLGGSPTFNEAMTLEVLDGSSTVIASTVIWALNTANAAQLSGLTHSGNTIVSVPVGQTITMRLKWDLFNGSGAGGTNSGTISTGFLMVLEPHGI